MGFVAKKRRPKTLFRIEHARTGCEKSASGEVEEPTPASVVRDGLRHATRSDQPMGRRCPCTSVRLLDTKGWTQNHRSRVLFLRDSGPTLGFPLGTFWSYYWAQFHEKGTKKPPRLGEFLVTKRNEAEGLIE